VDIHLEVAVIDMLSSKGVLAYVAVQMADGTEVTTAVLAGLVRVQTAAMLEGLKELSVTAPGAVTQVGRHWRCGVVRSTDGGEVIPIVDSDRYRILVDDLKTYWEFINTDPSTGELLRPFVMDGRDGAAIQAYLRKHRTVTREDWQKALNHRKNSVVKFGHATVSEPFWKWVRRLDEYAAGPLDRFGKPAEMGGKRGEAINIQDGNRAAGESFLHSIRANKDRGRAEGGSY
jgi:hypothetical protein